MLDASPDRKKIHVTVDMSSITGGLCQNFGAASSVKQCAEILAHYEEEILMHNEQKFRHITTRRYLNKIHYIRLPTERLGSQMHVVPSRPVPAADCFVDS